MNREIKFRAWSPDMIGNHFMYKWETIRTSFYDFLNDSETTVMQFTGLKDKNGVDIYEGDIVKDKYNTIGEVIYHSDYAGFASQKKYSDRIVTIQLDQGRNKFEVIGNVFENKELLK